MVCLQALFPVPLLLFNPYNSYIPAKTTLHSSHNINKVVKNITHTPIYIAVSSWTNVDNKIALRI